MRRSGNDRKWNELSRLITSQPEITRDDNTPRKLVIFTEQRDTLRYLIERLQTLLGRPEAIVTIHGGVRRSERREIEDRFRNDPGVWILVATDAAGEGINLQRAHLMVNYDLPMEPQPARAALRPHPPHRPDRGVPPVEPGGRPDTRGCRVSAAAEEAGSRA